MWPAGGTATPKGQVRGFWNPDKKNGKDNDRGLGIVFFIFLSLLVSVSVPFVMCGHAKPGGSCSDDTRSALSFAFQTEKGSALHEAALFGKTDVVHILLAAGEVGSAWSARMQGRAAFPGLPEGPFAGCT